MTLRITLWPFSFPWLQPNLTKLPTNPTDLTIHPIVSVIFYANTSISLTPKVFIIFSPISPSKSHPKTLNHPSLLSNTYHMTTHATNSIHKLIYKLYLSTQVSSTIDLEPTPTTQVFKNPKWH